MRRKLIPGTFMKIPPELQTQRALTFDELIEFRGYTENEDLLEPWEVCRWYALQNLASDEQIEWGSHCLNPGDEFNRINAGRYGPTFVVVTIYRGKIRSMGQYQTEELIDALGQAYHLMETFPKGHTYIHKSETDGEDEGVLWVDGLTIGVGDGSLLSFPI